MGMPFQPRSYCAEEVRRLDRERYLAALFAPDGRREALFALYAFDLEIAKTAEVVSEALLGEIRLQWWRDAIDELYAGSVREHPVLAALAGAVAEGCLERSRFQTMIDGRSADLDAAPPADLEALEDRIAATAVPLMALSCTALGAADEAAVSLVRDAALGLGLASVLRAVPFHARRRRLYIPASLMNDAGVGPAMLFDRTPPPAFSRAVEPVAARARSRIAAVRRGRREIPVAARAVFLTLAPAEAWLRRLARNGHDVFAPRAAASPLAAQIHIAWAALTRRYSAAPLAGCDQRSRSVSARRQ